MHTALIRLVVVACAAAAAPRINCTLSLPARVRAGDTAAARVDVAVARGGAFESLVVEVRARAGGGAGREPSVRFGSGPPGLEPASGDDDAIYAVRGDGGEERWLARLAARERRTVWATFRAAARTVGAFERRRGPSEPRASRARAIFPLAAPPRGLRQTNRAGSRPWLRAGL